ncbi:MAG: imidazolonepropionase [Dyella sp.]|uniref:imidazolonepropionase n=1 Tax=Dyella sp. TaxID=1869338 RepID=UPI003F80FCBA
MSTVRWDHLLLDATLATFTGEAPFGLICDGAIAIEDGRIAWVGPREALPGAAHTLANEVRSLDGALLTPGLIDCHTHLVFGGHRAHEFDLRLNGASYAQIAAAGGGIVSTVTATRSADEGSLLDTALARAKALLADGVTMLEIKSGYGLTLDDERKMLRVARQVGAALGVTVRTTFLGLHALPVEYRDRRDAYVDAVCDDWLPTLAGEGLIDAVDAFCEGIGFTPAETQRLFERARALGLPVKLHAEQLSDQGGAALVARYDGLSADHLEYLDASGVDAMARAGTVAVLLPGAFYALRETRLPPIDALRAAGVPMAVATDCNPGTSPLLSLRLAAGMACTLFRLTPEEALKGVTVHAARALGLPDRGTLAVGQRADLAVWNVSDPAELCYWIGGALLHERWTGGQRRAP